MQIEKAIGKIQELLNLTNWYPKYGYKEAIITVLDYIETMHKEFDRLEGIEDNTAMLKYELEKKDKVIDEMAAILTRYMSTIDNKPYDLSLGVSTRKMTLEEVKEYFYKKVSDNK